MYPRVILLTMFVLAGVNGWVSAQNIFRTACRGDIDKLDSLLNFQDIDVQDDRGRSLLHWALGCRKKVIFDLLLERHIDINIPDHQHRTPMHVAIQFEDLDAFSTLRDLQPTHQWKETHGPSLLQIAILQKSVPIVRSLLADGIDINVTNQRGSSPLEISKRIGADTIYSLLLRAGADATSIRSFALTGPYLGQRPADTVQMFAPNFISTEESEFGSAFNAAGTAFYYAVDVGGRNEIRYSRLIDNQWTDPVVLLSHDRYGYNDPFLSNDESKLFFISKRALDGSGPLKDVDIWYVQKKDDGWSKPINVGPNINSGANEYYISFTDSGAMYFSSNVHASKENTQSDYDIYYAEVLDDSFDTPIRLDSTINTEGYEADVFVAPDESYLIFCSTRAGGFGQGDLYISFKDQEGSWLPAINMANEINTPYYEYCPFVTKDGKYLFFTSNHDIYWVSSKIITNLRNK